MNKLFLGLILMLVTLSSSSFTEKSKEKAVIATEQSAHFAVPSTNIPIVIQTEADFNASVQLPPPCMDGYTSGIVRWSDGSATAYCYAIGSTGSGSVYVNAYQGCGYCPWVQP